MTTEARKAELEAEIHAIADGIRARGEDAVETREEHDASVALKQELDVLRNPPPPPPSPPTANQLRHRELLLKVRTKDLTLDEMNELIRLGGTT